MESRGLSESRTVASPAEPIDCHVHVFHAGLPLAPGHRYAPGYTAGAADLKAGMEQTGVGRAIVVQPSFLGFDNHHLLELLAAEPRLAGIAVVPPGTSPKKFQALREAGVVGLRLNCIGRPAPRLGDGPDRDLAESAAAAGLVLQIQAEGEQWRSIAPTLPALKGPIVVDHFGRTPPGDASGGFEALMEAARSAPHLWFKFSGPYRFASGAAAACAATILRVVGADRIVWGSDWPWTQFESRFTYAETIAWLDAWLPDPIHRHAVLAINPRRLFGF